MRGYRCLSYIILTSAVSLNALFLPLRPTYAKTDLSIQNNDPASQLAGADSNALESSPIAFKSSYVGVLINQNFALYDNQKGFAPPKTSWGIEYRFFYKDEWTLAISGEFKGQPDSDRRERSVFSISQETMKIFRLYHPWYIAAGGRISYHIPVKKISIPYERDQDRSLYPGGALTLATIYKPNESLLLLLEAHRWTSLSTQSEQGFSTVFSALVPIR